MDKIYSEVFSKNLIYNIQFENVNNGALDCKLAANDSATSITYQYSSKLLK